jgi:ABC-2 type transport system ATP-binding protein
LEQVGLGQAASLAIGACSKGMLQRLALAQAVIGDPPFLLLDEPLGGLDPAWQKQLREMVKSLAHEGRTVLFSTHRLSEVADVCTRVGILKQGRLVRAGNLDEVLPLRSQVTIAVDVLSPEMHAHILGLSEGITIENNRIILSDGALACKREVMQILLQGGADIQNLSHERATLEEIYLEAMSR